MISLCAVVTSGTGEAAGFMAIPWVRAGLRRLLGFDPCPGTLNVRLLDDGALEAWRQRRRGPALVLAPPSPDDCGARVYPVLLVPGESDDRPEPGVDAAILVPDVTRYGEDTLELIATLHLRSRLGLRDGDPLTLRIDA